MNVASALGRHAGIARVLRGYYEGIICQMYDRTDAFLRLPTGGGGGSLRRQRVRGGGGVRRAARNRERQTVLYIVAREASMIRLMSPRTSDVCWARSRTSSATTASPRPS